MGIPVLRFHFKWSENEIKMAKDMQETFRAIVEAAAGPMSQKEARGRPPLWHRRRRRDHSRTGDGSHGSPPENFCAERVLPGPRRQESVRHDGACFVTNPDKNPTLTIMALAWRASEYCWSRPSRGACSQGKAEEFQDANQPGEPTRYFEDSCHGACGSVLQVIPLHAAEQVHRMVNRRRRMPRRARTAKVLPGSPVRDFEGVVRRHYPGRRAFRRRAAGGSTGVHRSAHQRKPGVSDHPGRRTHVA